MSFCIAPATKRKLKATFCPHISKATFLIQTISLGFSLLNLYFCLSTHLDKVYFFRFLNKNVEEKMIRGFQSFMRCARCFCWNKVKLSVGHVTGALKNMGHFSFSALCFSYCSERSEIWFKGDLKVCLLFRLVAKREIF